MWKAWCISPSWAATTSALTKPGRSCVAGARVSAMASAHECGCRSVAWIWMDVASTSAWFAMARMAWCKHHAAVVAKPRMRGVVAVMPVIRVTSAVRAAMPTSGAAAMPRPIVRSAMPLRVLLLPPSPIAPSRVERPPRKPC
ncbi:hypothetical protein SDC9_116131 [bioreactor metagenome]|uniref:Uncharacterized protein n=1 Tax=bioreactor metagenome TaxID=1076179 RepID=A0A645BVF4_9ZZZZ